MLSRASRLRIRRRLHVQKRQVGELSTQAELHLERNFFRRLERLAMVRRFVLTWVLLVVLLVGIVVVQTRSLGSYYQEEVPIAGGTYREGILGQFTNANPVYAASLVDSSVSRLLFSSLLAYDVNNKLVGDLAESWEVNNRGDEYTVRLKPNLTWHDGEPLTADDVVFTYKVIQSPDARSPLSPTWRDVKVSAADEHTVVFKLPNPLASFPYAMTNGIIPEHILGNVQMAEMRSTTFNTTEPIGSGPFRWQALEVEGSDPLVRRERIALRAFEDYHAGRPQLSSFVIRTFRGANQLTESFKKQEINAVAGLAAVPEEFHSNPNIAAHNFLLTAQVMTFFRTEHEILKSKDIRRALVRSINTIEVMRQLDYPTKAVREPLLKGQLGYNANLWQLSYNLDEARKILNDQGWQPGSDGLRRKDGQTLSFALHTPDTEEYARVAGNLRQQWRNIGIDVDVVLEDESVLQNTLAYHAYDALLYGIAIGPDPDVFTYWHSSQAEPTLASRLNFSEYSSSAADMALADARTRLDPALRAAKLEQFLEVWRNDAPALGLYQPRFLYITRGNVYGLTRQTINSDTQRFAGVHNWMIRTDRQTLDFSE